MGPTRTVSAVEDREARARLYRPVLCKGRHPNTVAQEQVARACCNWAYDAMSCGMPTMNQRWPTCAWGGAEALGRHGCPQVLREAPPARAAEQRAGG